MLYNSIKSLKKIDIDFANKFQIKDGFYDAFYNNFLNYKKMYVTKNANVVFSILLAIFILTLFIINGVSNIYFLIFAIILAFINVVCFSSGKYCIIPFKKSSVPNNPDEIIALSDLKL